MKHTITSSTDTETQESPQYHFLENMMTFYGSVHCFRYNKNELLFHRIILTSFIAATDLAKYVLIYWNPCDLMLEASHKLPVDDKAYGE